MRNIIVLLAVAFAGCSTVAPTWTVHNASNADGTVTIKCWGGCQDPTQQEFENLVESSCQAWGYAAARPLAIEHDGADPTRVSIANSMRVYKALLSGVEYRILYQCTDDEANSAAVP